MKIEKNGTIVGVVQSEDPLKVRVQVQLDAEPFEQRVKAYPQSEEDRMAEQMSEQLARQLRNIIPGALVLGQGIPGRTGQNIEEWLVPADQASKLLVGRRVRVILEPIDEEEAGSRK